jgi:enoyl-CoA hydratase/carnithine racemase
VVVDYELSESVARVYLNRPHRLNAVVPELTAGLVAALAARMAPAWWCWRAAAGRSAPGMT